MTASTDYSHHGHPTTSTSPTTPVTPWDLTTSEPAKGRLWVKVVEARNLLLTDPSVASGHATVTPRPYCVVEFEKNEFVTREGLWDSRSSTDLRYDGPGGVGGGADMMDTSNGNGNGKEGGMYSVWKHEAT
ncbi:hypothetical protein HKX48_003003, partial [Thoreauomyces humboldtii]